MTAVEVPQALKYKGGQLNVAHVLEVENFTNWKKRFMCHIIGMEPQFKNIISNGAYIPMAVGQRKPETQWTLEERKAANLDQQLKSLIMYVLPDDQMNSVINCLTAKSTWDDLILYHEGPSDVKESRVMNLKLCYNTFKFKEGESLTQTFTRYKALINELVNDGIGLSKLEINTSFINGLPKTWLAFCQSLRNTNHVKESKLASLFDSPDDEEDTRSSQEYMNDLEEEHRVRALLAKSKRLFKNGTQSMACEGLITDGLFTNVISADTRLYMIRMVTNDEIKSFMFNIGEDRAPGPDGFTIIEGVKEVVSENQSAFILDDLFIFARGELDSARLIMESLDEFQKSSGLVLRFPKLHMQSFLVGGNGELACKPKVTWDFICLLKREGGLDGVPKAQLSSIYLLETLRMKDTTFKIVLLIWFRMGAGLVFCLKWLTPRAPNLGLIPMPILEESRLDTPQWKDANANGVIELRPTKDSKAKYNKVKAKLALLSLSASASKASMVKNKDLIVEAYEWDEEVRECKEGARNDEWVKISMKKKLDGVEPISGPKTIKSILRSKSTFKAETLKGVILNEPFSAPARSNKSSSALKVNSAPAGKLKSVKINDDPPLAIIVADSHGSVSSTHKEDGPLTSIDGENITPVSVDGKRICKDGKPLMAVRRGVFLDPIHATNVTSNDNATVSHFRACNKEGPNSVVDGNIPIVRSFIEVVSPDSADKQDGRDVPSQSDCANDNVPVFNKRVNFRTLINEEFVANNDTMLPKAAKESVMSRFGFVKAYEAVLSTVFLFKFDTKSGMDQVIERGPWLIRITPLILNKWAPNVLLKPGEVNKVPVWVKLYNVLVVAYSEDWLSLIATQVGKPIMLDTFTSFMCAESWGRISFARALIEIHANSELKKEVRMAIPIDDDDWTGYTSEVICVEYE
ncbi:retrovirus-related pol polyprotein from transposon TNT 1-94 [Tanacetum coccineum]|uniref:Retrovirus-related pol polyprotein from transposon TNT 1-94 n=1 Tax=Tanacetum coccineum TaxID=301880 RepID=A0ABQ5HX59_9ASTR